jgi:hypothetical protein
MPKITLAIQQIEVLARLLEFAMANNIKWEILK